MVNSTKMAIFSRTESKLLPNQIKEIENLIKLDFPDDYKKHLLIYNGGKCSPEKFTFKEKEKKTSSSVDWFLAIYQGEYDNLQNYIQIYKKDEKRLPTHIVPIAHDAGGNLICISCGKQDYGYVYFWDHENEVDYSCNDDSNYSNLYLIAKSFTEFINVLV
jgi:hypothetical protein